MSRKISIFISYSHQDAKYLEEDSLGGFLKGIQQEGIAEFWSDKRIATGELWDDEIKARIVESDISLVLVSQAFLNSKYCTDVEIGGFIARKVFIFPVMLSACEWQRHKWLHSRQFLPGGEETVEENYTEPGRRNRLFLEILNELRQRIEQLASQGPRRLLEAQQTAATKSAPLAPPPDQFIHGWTTERVQALQQQTAEALGLPIVFRDKFKDGGEGPELVVIPGGAFTMGSTDYDDEKPPHRVTVSTFYSMQFPVTRGLYRAVLGEGPSEWKKKKDEERLPANYVTWFDAVRSCNVLSERCGLQPCYRIKGDHVEWDSATEGYRLPTEAEWEYAVRAGTTTRWFCGDDEKELQRYAWYNEDWNSSDVHPVGEKLPNPWRLHDMTGNVWEWCWDWYGPYQANAAVDPVGSDGGGSRVLRGGSFGGRAGILRSVGRYGLEPEDRSWGGSFRCVRGSRRQP